MPTPGQKKSTDGIFRKGKGGRPPKTNVVPPPNLLLATPAAAPRPIRAVTIDQSSAAKLRELTHVLRVKRGLEVPMAIDEVIPAPKRPRKTTRIEVNHERLTAMFDEYHDHRSGSHQLSASENLILMHQVVILLIDWILYKEDKSETAKATLLKAQCPIPLNSKDEEIITIQSACRVISTRTGIGYIRLYETFYDCYVHGYIMTLKDPKSRKLIPEIATCEDVTLIQIGEIICFLMSRAAVAKTTSYKTIMKHLANPNMNDLNDPKLFEVGGDKCLPIVMSRFCIRALLVKHHIVKWSDIKKGGKTGGSPEDALKRLWVLRIQIAEYCYLICREEDGEIIIIIMDESYCHEKHSTKQSLVCVDQNAKPIKEMQGAARDGLRLCIMGSLCRWGHVGCTDPRTRKLVRACGFVNNNNVEVEKGGRMVEYSNTGEIRQVFRKKKALKINEMKKDELIEKCMHLPGFHNKMKVKDLKELLKSHQPPADVIAVVQPPSNVPLQLQPRQQPTLVQPAGLLAVPVVDTEIEGDIFEINPGIEESLNQLIFKDWVAEEKKYKDMPLITDLYFVEKKNDGDYHDNMNSIIFFKYCATLKNMFIEFMKELETKRLAGTLTPHTDKPFYNYETNKCCRKLHLALDGAPYHRCIEAQMSSKSKKEIGAILRELGVSQMQFTRIGVDGANDVTFNVEVPKEGEDFQNGHPTKEELIIAATNAILIKKPSLAKPPWVALFGNTEGFSCEFEFEYSFSKPYVSPFLCIEYKWSDIKNYVGADEQSSQSRSLATLHNQIQDRLNSGVTSAESLFKTCEKNMNNWIEEKDPDGPMKGKVPRPDGLPSYEDWKNGVQAEWYKNAGIDKDCYKYNTIFDNPNLAEEIMLAENMMFDENDIIF